MKRSNLKKHNKAEYNRISIKLDYFDEIPNMLKLGKFIKFYQYRTKPLTAIVADFVLYQDKREYILHLFLRQERNGKNQYSPVSFIVKSSNDRSRNQYIAGQEYKKVTDFKIIELDR